MKYNIFFLLFTIKLFTAQTYEVVVNYSMKFFGENSNAILLSNSTESVFFFCNHCSDIEYDKLIRDQYFYIHPNFIYKFDNKENVFYQTLPFFFGKSSGFSSKLAKDSAVAPQWTLSKETKTILGYSCQKAVGNFRGRTWEVWFTKDLQANIFPWKLQGLPGAILEAKEKDKILSFYASKISMNTVIKQPDIIKEFFDKEIPIAISYKDVVDKQTNVLKSILEESIANLPKGSVIVDAKPNYRQGEFEKSFEWETPKTQK